MQDRQKTRNCILMCYFILFVKTPWGAVSLAAVTDIWAFVGIPQYRCVQPLGKVMSCLITHSGHVGAMTPHHSQAPVRSPVCTPCYLPSCEQLQALINQSISSIEDRSA